MSEDEMALSRGFSLHTEVAAALAKARKGLSHPDPAEAARRCRVSLKRARALARLCQPADPVRAAGFNAKAGEIGRSLSALRDEGAVRAGARLALSANPGKAARRELRPWALAVAEPEQAVGADVRPILTKLRRLERARQTWPDAPFEALVEGAHRLSRRAEKAAERARGGKDVELRHVWRKREKARIAALRAMGPHWPGPKRLSASLALARALGAERDVLLLEERLAQVDAPAGLAHVRTVRTALGAFADALAQDVYR